MWESTTWAASCGWQKKSCGGSSVPDTAGKRSQHSRVLPGSGGWDPGVYLRDLPAPMVSSVYLRESLRCRPHSLPQATFSSSLLDPLQPGSCPPSIQIAVRHRRPRAPGDPSLKSCLGSASGSWSPGFLMCLSRASPKLPIEPALPLRADAAQALGTSCTHGHSSGWTPDSVA